MAAISSAILATRLVRVWEIVERGSNISVSSKDRIVSKVLEIWLKPGWADRNDSPSCTASRSQPITGSDNLLGPGRSGIGALGMGEKDWVLTLCSMAPLKLN